MEKEKVIERVKQIKARLQSYPMDAIADIHFILEFSSNLMEEMEKEVEENQRLKTQLDREIHINRKMKNALEKYADPFNDMQPVNELAKQVLKEIDNKE